MWKAVLAGTTALAIAGSTLVYAQQRGRTEGGERWRPTMADMQAFADARLAALHAGLELNADQEKNWPAFEQAAKEFSKLRLDRLSAAMAARRDGQAPSTDPADRMHKRAAAMTQTGTALQKLADATDPLYKSLDDSQKHRFAMLAHLGGRFRGGDRGREFRGRDQGGRDFNGPRRFEGGPNRTDFRPQGGVQGEQNL